MTSIHQNEVVEIGDDLRVAKITRQPTTTGTWVRGTIAGYRFDALIFAEHAADPEWELAESRISKLWLKRLADRTTVFNWDRGPDVAAADETARAIVDFLAAGLADYVYAE